MTVRSPQDAARPCDCGPSDVLPDGAADSHPGAGPVCLPLHAAFRPAAEPEPDLTVVIPAYNEASRLPRTLRDLTAYLDDWGLDYRVLVIDDGSSDGTADLVEPHGGRCAVLRQPNGGKGSAVRRGMLQASGRVIAFTDADLPYHLDTLRTAHGKICRNEVDVVFGARDLRESSALAPRRLLRSIAHEAFRQCMRVLVSRQVGDTQCGLKIFSRRAAREIFSRCQIDGFAFDAEVVYLTHALGLSFYRAPVVLVNEYASTISLSRHALPMLLDVLALRWRSLTEPDPSLSPGQPVWENAVPQRGEAVLARRPAA